MRHLNPNVRPERATSEMISQHGYIAHKLRTAIDTALFDSYFDGLPPGEIAEYLSDIAQAVIKSAFLEEVPGCYVNNPESEHHDQLLKGDARWLPRIRDANA
jgi:hypothetical protein